MHYECNVLRSKWEPCSFCSPLQPPFPPTYSFQESDFCSWCNNTKLQYKILKIALWLIIITINVIHRWQMCPRRNQVECLHCTSPWGEKGILSDPGITDHNVFESTTVNESSPARKCFNQGGIRNYYIKTRKKLLLSEYLKKPQTLLCR